MSPLFSVFAISLGAGFLGAMLGLGGGIFLVPLLTLLLDLPIHTVVATSLLGVIVTSSVASTTYCRTDQTNVRLGFLLETVTAVGAIAGGLIATNMSPTGLKIIFGVVALYTAYSLCRQKEEASDRRQQEPRDDFTRYWDVSGTCRSKPDSAPEDYKVKNLPAGLAVSFVAGNVSALLGIGGGPLKVPIMSLVMKVPLKAAVATSTFMVGITASVTALIYYFNGFIELGLVAPAVFGILVGASGGALTAQKSEAASLRWLLSFVLAFLAVQMLVAAF